MKCIKDKAAKDHVYFVVRYLKFMSTYNYSDCKTFFKQNCSTPHLYSWQPFVMYTTDKIEDSLEEWAFGLLDMLGSGNLRFQKFGLLKSLPKMYHGRTVPEVSVPEMSGSGVKKIWERNKNKNPMNKNKSKRKENLRRKIRRTGNET